eukprot:CAMPEP_0119389876 /NCGR_PEP_ID=MMETSP1334-20130426/111140_1 /TAXON_ID=127549 /ORGANISM="Calcidiscus leptoporus, Strain RCC1130" /LENGTH=242 /DNA_ID=CAMNT_0007412221 /DNA_START=131 /DNA_END=855 /DNA_ORIENTATION=-
MGDIDPSLLLEASRGLKLAPLKQYAQPTRALSAPPSVDDIDSLFCELNHVMDKSSRLLNDTVVEEGAPLAAVTELQRSQSTSGWASGHSVTAHGTSTSAGSGTGAPHGAPSSSSTASPAHFTQPLLQPQPQQAYARNATPGLNAPSPLAGTSIASVPVDLLDEIATLSLLADAQRIGAPGTSSPSEGVYSQLVNGPATISALPWTSSPPPTGHSPLPTVVSPLAPLASPQPLLLHAAAAAAA